MIKTISKLIIALNSNSRPSEMASAIAFGFCLAIIPGGNLLWYALFIIAFFIKQNTAALLLSMGLFKLLAPVLDTYLNKLGDFILRMPTLQDLFTSLYNIPLLPYTHFNNTLVMGGFSLGLLLWLPLFLIFILIIKFYRKTLAAKLAHSRLIQWIKKIPLISRINDSVKKMAALA